MASYPNGKICRRCGDLKPEDAFGRHRKRSENGKYYMYIRHLCKPCRSAYNSGLREKNRVPLSAKICPTCKNEFTPSRRDNLYCSQRCKSKAEFLRRPPYIKKPLVFRIIECKCGYSFFSLSAHKLICDACKLENVRQAARERMRRLRADPILGPSIKADGWKRLEKWKSDNPEKVKANDRIRNQRREHRKQQLPATLTVKEWEHALEYFEWACAYCGEPSSELQQEHFIPLAKGGGYTKVNIVPACPDCNYSKRDSLPQDWLPEETYVEVSEYLVKGVE